MIYKCSTCGETFNQDEVCRWDGYTVCPVCYSKDIILVWDEVHPAAGSEDAKGKEAK